LLVVDETKVSVVDNVVFFIVKLHSFVIFHGSKKCLKLCLIVSENVLISENHNLFDEFFLMAADISELFCDDHEDTKVVVSHLFL
jgi:hypothetical protein